MLGYQMKMNEKKNINIWSGVCVCVFSKSMRSLNFEFAAAAAVATALTSCIIIHLINVPEYNV